MKYVKCDCGRTSRLVQVTRDDEGEVIARVQYADDGCRSKWHPHARLIDVSRSNRIWVEDVELTGATRDWEAEQEITDRMLAQVLESAGVGPVERLEPKEDLIPR